MFEPPQKLYKYCSFGVNALQLLSVERVFYANPNSFNDPLDCNASIYVDSDRASLEKLCFRMMVDARDKVEALKDMQNHRYASTEYGNYKTDYKAKNYYIKSLALRIKELLNAEMASWGVLSMAQRWDCPLMWSHYADEHRGLCIEFNMAGHACGHIGQVKYNRPRGIRTSELIQWKLHKSTEARRRIVDAIFFTKSPQWRYEKEWRDIHQPNGLNSAPFHISGVFFGLRCDPAVRTSIVKLFTSTNRDIRFYNLSSLEDSFRLKRSRVNTGEIEAVGVQASVLMDFNDVFIDEDKLA